MIRIKKYFTYSIIVIAIFIFVLILQLKNTSLNINYKANEVGQIQLYYYNNNKNNGYPFSEEASIVKELDPIRKINNIKFNLKISQLKKIRIDFNSIHELEINNISVSVFGVNLLKFTGDSIIRNFTTVNDVKISNNINIDITGKDAFIGNENVNIQNIIIKMFIMSLIISVVIILLITKLNIDGVINIKKISITPQSLLIYIFIFIIIMPNIVFYLPENKENINIENRTLMENPKLDITEFGQYTKNFETYYYDNLPFKNKLVKLNSNLKLKLMNISSQKYVIKGNEDWLFYNSKHKQDADTLADYNGTNYYTKQQLEAFKNKIINMKNVSEANGAEFYVMINPNKSQIYSEYMPNKYQKQNLKSKTDLIVDYIRKNTDIKIIYPKEELLKLKDKYQLYYKLDTHWNNLGAYVAYRELKREIDSVNVDSLDNLKITENERLGGDLASMIGLNTELKENEYNIENVNKYRVNLIEESGRDLYRYNSQNKNNKKIVCFRDSFLTAVIPYINQDYEESLFLWQNKFDENLIKKEKPNVVLIESVERLIDNIN